MFTLAATLRASTYYHALALNRLSLLDKYCQPGIRPFSELPPERQLINRPFMMAHILTTKTVGRASHYHGECCRFAMGPLFGRWVRKQAVPGTHFISCHGYFNDLIEWIQEHGGSYYLDAGSSHPSNFWSLMAEEYARWDCPLPPIWPRHHLRQQKSAVLADYVLAPSRFVEDSYAQRGFPKDRIFRLPYPVNRSVFTPREQPRPADRPLTLASSGLLSLRKGSGYLFEAFKLIRKEVPDARLKLIRAMASNFEPAFKHRGYDQLPVEWSGKMPHAQLADWLRDSDFFVLPTIEEGMVRSAAEALCCGIKVITTPNAGADDHIIEGENGSIVPIRAPQAIADAVLAWWDRMQSGDAPNPWESPQPGDLSLDSFTSKLQSIINLTKPATISRQPTGN